VEKAHCILMEWCYKWQLV